MSLINSWIEVNYGFEMLDVLQFYDRVFDNLGIDADLYYEYMSDNPQVLQDNCNEIILLAAQDKDIIPEKWDIKEWFRLDNGITCTPPVGADKEMVEEVIDNFNKWIENNITIEW